MSIWVCHARCGSGHTVAAQAVYDVVGQDRTDVELYDLLDESPSVRRCYGTGYRCMVTRMPALWRLMYDFSDNVFGKRFMEEHNLIVFRRFVQRLLDEQPDWVISTHFFASQIVSSLKRRRGLQTRLLTVVTDFDVHRLWVNRDTDVYVVADSFTRDRLSGSFNVDPSRIFPWGIPLRRGVISSPSAAALRKQYGVPSGVPLFLIFSSDFGAGPMRAVIDDLASRCGLLVITGDNSELAAHLDTITGAPFLYHVPRHDRIWELMAMADAVVLKAGGLSVSECFYLQRPMVIMHTLYGQETGNARFICDNGYGYCPADTGRLLRLLERMTDDPSCLGPIRANLEARPRIDSAEKIRELLAHSE